MNRRQLLQKTLAGPGTVWLSGSGLRAAGETDSFGGLLDSNVSLFRWPFRRLPLDETAKLVEKLRSLGVTRAWAGSFEGVFQRDLASANARLVETCDAWPELVPVGSVNPTLPGWERDLDDCASEPAMPAIRLHPNYHGYSLEGSLFGRLLSRAAEAGLLVQLAVTLEDVRTQPERVILPDVDPAPLPEALARVPGARVQLLNLRPRGTQLQVLAKAPNLSFDTARADGTDGVASLLRAVGEPRVLFGSHAPFLIPEAALIRVHESALEPAPLHAVLRNNAERLIR